MLVFIPIKMFRRKNIAYFNAFSCKSLFILYSSSAFCLTRERGKSLVNKSINLNIIGNEIQMTVGPQAQTADE
jgi:hypothetical protein